MDAVLETAESTGFDLWPTAEPPADGFLVLSAELSLPEVGTAMAVWTEYNDRDGDDSEAPATGGIEAIRRTVAAEATLLPGGLRVRDTDSGLLVAPGCCCGLEDWRDWLGLLNGEEPWLGHAPTPRVEHADRFVRLWPDGGDTAHPPASPPLVLPLAELPGLLHSAHDRLLGFLTRVELWAARYAPPPASALAAKLDEDLHISAPLL